MKKYILLLAFLLTAAGWSQAQTEKSQWLLGGNVWMEDGDITNPSSSTHYNYIMGGPKVGFFIKDNLLLGLQMGIIFQKVDESKVNQIYIAPSVRYYLPNNHKLKFFAEFMAAFTNIRYEIPGQPLFKSHGFEIAAAPGLVDFPIKKLALELNLARLRFSQTKDNQTIQRSKTEFNTLLNDPQLGIHFYLGKSK